MAFVDPQMNTQGINKDSLVRMSQDPSIFQQCLVSDVYILDFGPTLVYPALSHKLIEILLFSCLKTQHKANDSSSGGARL